MDNLLHHIKLSKWGNLDRLIFSLPVSSFHRLSRQILQINEIQSCVCVLLQQADDCRCLLVILRDTLCVFQAAAHIPVCSCDASIPAFTRIVYRSGFRDCSPDDISVCVSSEAEWTVLKQQSNMKEKVINRINSICVALHCDEALEIVPSFTQQTKKSDEGRKSKNVSMHSDNVAPEKLTLTCSRSVIRLIAFPLPYFWYTV